MWRLSATELLSGYRSRELSPVEVVRALLERIEAADPGLGAFTAICAERALAEARTAESGYAAGEAAGPLAGVPFAAKDLFDSAGVRTTYGSPMFAGHVPDRDAAALAAVRAAGGILLGKTQTHEFAWGITTVNPAMGTTHNPWLRERVAGGSSGGSAAALAAGLVPLALGSDTGGSIRIPAAFCGVCGLKPTYGRVATDGVWPLAPSLDHAGPMARTPADLALLLAAMEGSPAMDPPAHGVLGGATVVTCPELPVPGETLATFEALGAQVVERPFYGAARALDLFRVIQGAEAARVHRDAGLWPGRAAEYGDDVRGQLERAGATLDDYAAATLGREALRAEMSGLVRDGALLVTPVAPVPPPPVDGDHSGFRAAVLPCTVPHDLTGLPSCAVRSGFDELGLPVGIQIAGAAWADERVLGAALDFHAATPELQARRPPSP